MSVPRITLWTDSFEMPLRWSVRPFNERGPEKQVLDIQNKTPRIIEITPGALFILSSIAGRHMTEPARWILFDSLWDILDGHLRTQYPERQDLLASTFGELLGVVLLALHLGGEVEIVRLLDSNYGKTPDFLLLQTTSTGQTVAHILECKGRVNDVHNVNEHIAPASEFDLCREVRRLRTKARAQINTVDLSQVKVGSKTVMRQKKMPFGLAQLAATKNILISTVPDSRIRPYHAPLVQFARRPLCGLRGITCDMCMANKTQVPAQANVISVLYQGKIKRASPLGSELAHFIEQYQTVQRAAWSGNDTFFGASLDAFIDLCTGREIRDVLPSAVFMVITLIETALAEELTHAHFEVQPVRAIAPEGLQDILEQVYRYFLHVRQASRRSLEPADRQRWSEEDRQIDSLSDENRKWYESEPTIAQIVDFAGAYRETKLLIGTPFQGDYVYGSAQYEDPSTTVIRLLSATRNRPALKTYVQGLIARLRSRRDEKLEWHSEYFREAGQEPFDVGESWDEYPYPHPTNEALPGITAWLAEDGRAEIIVRKLEPV